VQKRQAKRVSNETSWGRKRKAMGIKRQAKGCSAGKVVDKAGKKGV
jgi:hypothetical protein